mgnify:CR=1 FL=1
MQSGFAESPGYNPYAGEHEDPADRSLKALKQAILDALIESGQFTPEMLEEYARIQDTLKSDAVRPDRGIGFVSPGMLRSRNDDKK